MGDEKSRLQHLFAANSNPNSKIIYSDGIKKISVSFNEVQKHVFFIQGLLKNLNITRTTVCILTEQGLALPAIILGILNVDSAFAFLDVYKPFESLLSYQQYELIKTLIVQEHYLKDLKSQLCCCWKKTSKFYVFSEYILLQSIDCKNDACPNSKVYEKCEMHSEIAFIIQTSGTTGEPKIVKVPHSCIIPNIIDLRCKLSVTVDDVILQSTPITFDPSIIEIFLSLSSGAALVMILDDIRYTPTRLLDIIAANNITMLQGTPSLIYSMGEKAMKEILSNESVLRVLAFNGEICPSFSKLQQWKSERNRTEIYNLYGLTEISCYATCFRIDFQTGKSLSSIPLGDPLLNTVTEIYDKNGEISDTGEMHIGGLGRFCIINDEEWPKSSDSMMRPTGDIVHKTADGFIYFEGRADNIMKYKGHNISLQLIYNIVDTFPELETSFLHFDAFSSKLYIFIALAPERSFDSEKQREFIRKLKESVLNLPAIVFFPVLFFPVTKNGKIDMRKLLSLLDANQVQKFSAESTMGKKSEDMISVIWKNYTNQTIIMETDNFIMNGGDSLTAVQFMSDIEWHFQLSLPLLIEKILNETFKDVKQYVNLCLEDNYQSAKATLPSKSNSHSLESVNQPSSTKMFSDFKCFKFASKKGYFEYCFHSKNSVNCFQQKTEVSQSCILNFSLVLKWDLKKCIDATPCIFYERQLNQHYIFIGSHFGIFSCINLNEKLEKWQILVPGRIESSACISSCGNYVLFGCYDHHLYCIKIADGSISWKYETGAEVKSSPTVSFSNKAFVGSHDKHVYAIDVKSGCLLWKKQVTYGSIFSSPSIIESLCAVCISTLDGTLALLSMESGDILWKFCFGKPLFSSPVIISNYILIGSTDNCILCLDFTGKEVFKYATEGPVFSSAACFNSYEKNLVVFGCHDFHVYCLTLTGHLVWKTLCDSAIYAAPLQFKLNNCLYICVASSKGTLYILDIKNGKVVLSWNCPGQIFSSPVILDGILAVGCRDNNIYCFTLEASTLNII